MKDDNNTMISGGELLLKILNKLDIKYIFGTTGAGMPDIQDAISNQKEISWISGLHEFTSVAASTGYALVSGKTSIAMIDRMVGTQNALGAMYGAFSNMAPVMIISSQNEPGVPMITNEVEIHYSSMQLLLSKIWCKWSHANNSIQTLPFDLLKAYQISEIEPKCPVYISLRQDIMADLFDPKRINHLMEIGNVKHDKSYRIPDEKSLMKILDCILKAQNPIMIIGHGGRNKDYLESFLKFAHHFAIGVLERRFFLNYPMTDNMHLGFIDKNKPPVFDDDVDLAIFIELGLTPNQTLKNNVKIIDLESDPLLRQGVSQGGDYGSSYIPTVITCICDNGPTLEKIIELSKGNIPKEKQDEINKRREKISKIHNEMLENTRIYSKSEYQKNVINIGSIGFVLNKHWNAELIWVNGTSALQSDLVKYVTLTEMGSYYTNPSGHLGNGAGMALGVGIWAKDNRKIVICTIGDGEAIFGNIESVLWSIKHYNLPIIYIILNNGSWGVEWPFFTRSTKKYALDNKDTQFVDLDKPRFDFKTVGESLGIVSYRANDVKEFDSLMNELLNNKSKLPCLIELYMEKFPK